MDHHLLLLQRPQQQQQQQQHSSSTCCCITRYWRNTADATPSIEQILHQYKQLYFAGGIPRYSSSSPHLQLDIDTHEPRCNIRSEYVPCLGLLHDVAPAVPSAGRTRARTPCCLRRRDGKECRLYTHNGTKALIRHLHKTRHHNTLYTRGDLPEMHRTNVAVFGG